MWNRWFGRKKPLPEHTSDAQPVPGASTARASPDEAAAPLVHATDIQAAQVEVVRAVAACVADVQEGQWDDRDWLRIVANIEAFWDQPGRPVSRLAFSVARRPGMPLETVSFRFSPAARQAVAELARQMHAHGGQWWTVCELIVERNGAFGFTFSYDAPYRLSGKLNDTRFDDYLARYEAETRTSP